MALREMLLKLGVDVDKQAEQQALSGLDKLKAAAKVVAAAFAAIKGAQAFLAVTDEIRGLGDEIDKTSQQLGLSVQALEEFRHAANLSGVAGREMSDTLGRLQKNAFEAATGNKTLAEDFARLGVTVTDAAGEVKTGEVLLAEMADGFASLDNETEKVGLSLNLMGRAGRKLLPLLNAGSKGIAEMREEARDLGGVFGDELIKQSVILTDDQARLEFAMRGLKATIAGELMPGIIEATQRMTQFAVSMRGPLSTAIRFVRRIIEGFTGAAAWLGDKLGVLGYIISGLTVAVTGLGVAYLVMGKKAAIAAALAAKKWIVVNAPFILTGVLLAAIIAAILLVIEDLQGMGEGAESVSGTIAQGFLDSVDALGSWSAAVKDIFATTFEYWLGISRDTFNEIADVVGEAVGQLLAPVEATIGFIINLFGSLIVFFSDVFTKDLITAFSNLWDNLRGMVQDLVSDIMGFFKPLFDFVGKGLSAVADMVGIDLKGRIEAPEQETNERVAQVEQAALVMQEIRPQPEPFLMPGMEPEPFRVVGPEIDTAALGETLQTVAAVVEPRANVAGVSPMSVVSPAAGAPLAQSPSVVNQPQTDIKVDVDARGRPDSDAIGESVAREVDAVLKRRDQQTMRAYLQLAGGS